MLCPHCRFNNIEGSVFCSSCGGLLAPAQDLSAPGPIPPPPRSSSSVLPQGAELLGGAYVIDRPLGQGGFAITYAAADVRLARKVAIKEFFPSGSTRHGASVAPGYGWNEDDYNDARQRFVREGQMLARFRNPAIVDVLLAFEENNTAYLVMELLQGQTLRDLVDDRGPLPEHEALAYTKQVAEALEEIHGAGLLHRDIKPSNVILTPGGRIVLVDFGAAKEYAAAGVQTHSVVLTPGYAPLEQYASSAPRGPYTDVYGLAGTLYYLLTAEHPSPATDRLQGKEPHDLRQLNPAISSQTAAAVRHGMAMQAADRPQSAGGFLHDLLPGTEPGLADSSPTAGAPGATTTLARPSLHTPHVPGASVPLAEPRPAASVPSIPPFPAASPGVAAPRRRRAVAGVVFAGAIIAGVAAGVLNRRTQNTAAAYQASPKPRATPGAAGKNTAHMEAAASLSTGVKQPARKVTLVSHQDDSPPPSGRVMLAGNPADNSETASGNPAPAATARAVTKAGGSPTPIATPEVHPARRKHHGALEEDPGRDSGEQHPEPSTGQDPPPSATGTTGAGPPVAPVTMPPQNGGRTYEAPALGFSLTPPAGWSVSVSREADATRTWFRAPGRRGSVMVEVAPGSSPDYPVSTWKGQDSEFRQMYGDRYRLLHAGRGALGGHRSTNWLFTLRPGARDIQKLDVLTYRQGKGYAVLCAAPASDFGSLQDVFTQAIESFHFTD